MVATTNEQPAAVMYNNQPVDITVVLLDDVELSNHDFIELKEVIDIHAAV